MPRVTVKSPSSADRALLDRAQKAVGLSRRRFAEDVLLRQVSTVRRWRAGTSRMPTQVRRRLQLLTKGARCPCCLGTGVPPEDSILARPSHSEAV
jgi:DNA-binding transcriptional regulator YiaG